MNSLTKGRPAVGTLLKQVRRNRAAQARRAALARDLRTFDTPAAMLDLSAMLDRYPDQETAELRAAINWSRVA